MFLLWRAFYRLLESRPATELTLAVLRLAAAVKGRRWMHAQIDRLEHRLAFSGWPAHPSGWTNLHMSRFFTTLRRRVTPAVPPPPRRAVRPGDRVKMACVGKFRGLLGFPGELFVQRPERVELTIVDLAYDGHAAAYLQPLADRYMTIALDNPSTYDDQLRLAAAAVADVDLLLNANMKRDAHDLLDRVDTPCVFNYCTGSDLLHHDRVDVQLHGQPQADYFVDGRRMFCGTTRAWFSDRVVVPFRGLYDRRGLNDGGVAPWEDRDPLIVFHGSLYKLASPALLDCLWSLLAGDSALEFVFMGRHDSQALDLIEMTAKRRGVSARVHYEGQFVSTRNADGCVDDPGWSKIRGYLGRARLAPDPWPIGGGSARFECYALGVPSVHMGVRFDRASWGRQQPAVIDVLPLVIPAATATSPEQYRKLCERCLHDAAFAHDLAVEQRRVARRASDPQVWWAQVLDCYDEWRRERERS